MGTESGEHKKAFFSFRAERIVHRRSDVTLLERLSFEVNLLRQKVETSKFIKCTVQYLYLYGLLIEQNRSELNE